MSFKTISTVSAVILGIVVFCIAIFLIVMLINKNNIRKSIFDDCPKFIYSRYMNWYVSFVLWTAIEYSLLIIPLFTSAATVYFATDTLSGSQTENSVAALTVLSLVSFLLPTISAKILPKTHADGFYYGIILLENAMLKYADKLISYKELIDLFEKAESYTNPLAKKQENGSYPDEKTDE